MNALTWLVLLTSITSSSEVASTTSITSSGVASVAERSAAESGSCRLPVVPHKAQQGLPKTQVIYSTFQYVCVCVANSFTSNSLGYIIALLVDHIITLEGSRRN